MNVSNIIEQLQRKSQETDDSLTLMTLSKMIEQLQLGKVEVVSTVNDLPALPLEENGQLYLVENDANIYFNSNQNWTIFPTEEENVSFLYGWGRNNVGQLGTNDRQNREVSPVTVVGDITNWSTVSARRSIFHGLTSDGVLYTAGSGSNLGTGDTISRSSPVTVVGSITNWSAVSGGPYHTLGLTDTGELYVWGRDSAFNVGLLGTGDSIGRSSPVTVLGGITDWSAISASNSHSLALTSTGVLYSWGQNFGRLGDNEGTNKSSPVTVVGGITDWSAISASTQHSFGLTDSGVLYAWGNAGGGGFLGTGDTISRSSPVTVVGGITNWNTLSNSYGGRNGAAITDAGVLYAWGDNYFGDLGTNDTVNRSSPVTVVGGITNWSSVATGQSNFMLGLTDSGVLYAWGRRNGGFADQLGTDGDFDRSSPVTVLGGITTWSSISAGDTTAFAISSYTRNKLL